MTLPTREEANESAMYCDWIGNPDGRLIVEAYADGELLTKAEWVATIDYDAADDVADENDVSIFLIREGVAAALGFGETT